jgi:hypothetical protein
MKTLKINFTNNLGKADFVLLDSTEFLETYKIIEKELGFYSIISIEDVTGKFVDVDGTIKEINKK